MSYDNFNKFKLLTIIYTAVTIAVIASLVQPNKPHDKFGAKENGAKFLVTRVNAIKMGTQVRVMYTVKDLDSRKEYLGMSELFSGAK